MIDYKKKYLDALERANSFQEKYGGDYAGYIFPELRDSEDEMIRKRLLWFLANYTGRWDYPETRMACRAWLEKQKEQKPVQSDVEKEYVRTLKSLISDFLRGKEDVDREYYQQIFDWLDGRHIEQKPVDFPTTDEEVNEFLETHSKVEVPEKYKTPDFVFSKQEYKSYPIISKDTTSVKPAEWSEDIIRKAVKEVGLTQHQIDWFKNNVFPPKPEWSEEDRLHYANVLEALEYVKGCKSDYDKIEAVKSDISWLKLLRNRVGKDSLQPHWKPSEEQIYSLGTVVKGAGENSVGSVAYNLKELYEQLKRLKEDEQ